MTIGKMTAASAVRDQAVSLAWDDGYVGVVDLSASISRIPDLAPLADIVLFSKVALSHDGWSIEWRGGFDFGTRQLRRWAEEQAGDTMPASAFRLWIARHDLTLDAAADSLGLSRRTIAYYLSGELPVPKTVMLATEGFDHRKAA